MIERPLCYDRLCAAVLECLTGVRPKEWGLKLIAKTI